jgi:hypothetical protein
MVRPEFVRAVTWTLLLLCLFPIQLKLLGPAIAWRDALSALILIPVAWRNVPLDDY